MRALMMLLLAAASTSSAGKLPWDGPLLPIDSGHVILQKQCDSGPLPWSATLQKIAHGLEPGERVWMIVPDAAVAVTLGKSTCLVGEECGGAWVALRLPPKATRNAVAVVPKRFFDESVRVTAPMKTESRSGACDKPPAMQWTPLECTTWDLGFRGLRLHVQTESKGVEDTGWELIRTHVRVFGEHAQKWQLISEGVDDLTPRAVLLNADSCRILWRMEEGIGSPSRITVQLSRITPDGLHRFGRRYEAGGQPCD